MMVYVSELEPFTGDSSRGYFAGLESYARGGESPTRPDWLADLDDAGLLLAEAVSSGTSPLPLQNLGLFIDDYHYGRSRLDERSAIIVDLTDKMTDLATEGWGIYAKRLGQIAQCHAFIESLK